MTATEFNKWLKTAPVEDLQARFAAGPVDEEAQEIMFELQRRGSRPAFNISVLAILISSATLLVMLLQWLWPTDSELAKREQMRREVASLYNECIGESGDLQSKIVVFQSSIRDDETIDISRKNLAELLEIVSDIHSLHFFCHQGVSGRYAPLPNEPRANPRRTA